MHAATCQFRIIDPSIILPPPVALQQFFMLRGFFGLTYFITRILFIWRGLDIVECRYLQFYIPILMLCTCAPYLLSPPHCPGVPSHVPAVASVHTEQPDTHWPGESDAVTLPGTETHHGQYLGGIGVVRLLSSEHHFIMSVAGLCEMRTWKG